MLGACIGDAAGATLEFLGRLPTVEEVDAALKMPGSSEKTGTANFFTNGRMRLQPGQITDDGELTLALWSALYKDRPKLGPPIEKMIMAYVKWLKSGPIDIGRTCHNAFDAGRLLLEGRTETIDEFLHRIATVNGASQANGALMRVTALVHWAAGDQEVPPSTVALMARVDAQLSHPNSVCQDCNAIYAYAATLLERRVPPHEAFKLTSEFVMQNIADQTVLKWFFNDSQDITTLNCRENMGHVRWGFTLAFHFLQNPHISFEEALRQTLRKGGSAAIVGGLVGSYQTIPDYMKKPVMTLRAERRPEWLWPWTYFS